MNIVFELEQGNNKLGFRKVGLMDANTMFEIVYEAQSTNYKTKNPVTQWQDKEYTYISYGDPWTLFRYKVISLDNTKEKEAD